MEIKEFEERRRKRIRKVGEKIEIRKQKFRKGRRIEKAIQEGEKHKKEKNLEKVIQERRENRKDVIWKEELEKKKKIGNEAKGRRKLERRKKRDLLEIINKIENKTKNNPPLSQPYILSRNGP